MIKDLEKPSLLERVNSFAGKMRDMRAHLARVQKLRHKEQERAWFGIRLNFIVMQPKLLRRTCMAKFETRGFLGFADYLCYASSVASGH